MDKRLIVLPLLAIATPVTAQPPTNDLQRELTDPATAQRLTRSMQAMSKALLDLRIGELQAATEGREATPEEKNRTVRDLGRRNDPNFDRNFSQRVAHAGPVIDHSLKAMNEAMPSILQAVEKARDSLERAVANMPDPTYPKR